MIKDVFITDKEAREAKNAYQRAWRAAHKDQVKETNRRYWRKKAAQLAAEQLNASGSEEQAAQ